MEFSAEQAKRFEQILELESELAGSRASLGFRPNGTPLYRLEQLHRAVERARTALYGAVDELSLEDMRAYGVYRAEMRAKYAAMAAEKS